MNDEMNIADTNTALVTIKIMPAHVLELVRMIVEQRARRSVDEKRGAVFWIPRKEKA